MDVREFFDDKRLPSAKTPMQRDISNLKGEMARKDCEIRRLERAVLDLQDEVKTLQLTIVRISQEKIDLTQKFLDHIQERQRDDRAWVESLRNKY